MKQICAVLRRVPKTIWLLLGVGALILVPFLFFGGPIEAWFLRMADPSAGTARQVMGWVLFGLLAFDVVLPVPSSLASTLCGVLFGLWGGFWLSFGAMTVSAALGYVLGRLCSGWARRTIGEHENALLRDFLRRYGTPILIALRTVPVLAEASTLFAGIGRMPLRRAVPPLVVGNAAVSLIYAWVGSLGRSTDAMIPAFLGSLVLSALLLLGARWLRPRRG